MAIHARSTATLLRYSLKTVPSPVPVSGENDQDLRLELKIEAPVGQSAHLKKIEIRYPCGPDAGDLSQTDPRNATTAIADASPPAHGSNWTREGRVDGGDAVYTFTNARLLEFSGTNTVTLVVSGIYVNKALGRTQVRVTEWTSQTGSGTPVERPLDEPFLIDKWPSEFTFANLRPDKITVRRGETVTLTWEASRGPAYTMHWDDHHTSVTGEWSWESLELERTTGFMLKAEMSDPGGGAPLIYALTTAVTVTEPNLTVGDLKVNGIVRMQQPKAVIPAPPRNTAKYYRADTDGRILGYLQAASGQPAATVTATVYREGVGEYTARFSSDNSTGVPTETPISVPIPAGAQVRLLAAGNTGDTLNLLWLPTGPGAFTELAPPSA